MNKMMVLFLCLITFNTYSAGVETHGGDGWLDDAGKPYLYDLKEGGIHTNPYFDKSFKAIEAFRSEIKSAIPFISKPTLDLLLIKLAEVENIYPALAYGIASGITTFYWTGAGTIIDIKDEDPILNIPKKRIVQLAGRRSNEIFIDLNWWKKLDKENRVALIFHEMIYAYLVPTEVKLGNINYFKQRSSHARFVVRYLFSSRFSKRGLKGLKHTVKSLDFSLMSFDRLKYAKGQYKFVPFNELNGQYTFWVRLNNGYSKTLKTKFSFDDELGVKWTPKKRNLAVKNYCKYISKAFDPIYGYTLKLKGHLTQHIGYALFTDRAPGVKNGAHTSVSYINKYGAKDTYLTTASKTNYVKTKEVDFDLKTATLESCQKTISKFIQKFLK